MKALIFALSFVVLLPLLASACASEAKETPTPSPRAISEQTAQKMASLSSLTFSLEHLEGVTPLTPGLDMRQLEGSISLPDSFELTVSAEATGFTAFISMKVIVMGDRGYITDPLSRKWRELSPNTLPFNFADMGNSLSRIILSIQDPSFVGSEDVDGVATWRIRGSVSSDILTSLVTTATPGRQVALELWVDQELGLLRRAHIEGPIAANDPPEITRLLTLHGFDEPVKILPPQ